jgi:predicted O-methyltransferase YrrM
MSAELWAAVDDYVERTAVVADRGLADALAASSRAGLPSIQVSAAQGKLLYLLARLAGGRSLLEIGTLGGYSAIWLARALAPGGRLTTLELEEAHAEVARANLDRTGLSDRVTIIVGPARETLASLAGPFDMTFIDADKASIVDYFDRAVALSRPGGLIVVDNVVRKGRLVEEESDDPNVLGVRRFHEALSRDGRVEATTIQTVGVKGYDGFTLAVVRSA